MKKIFFFLFLYSLGFAQSLEQRLQDHIHYDPDAPNYIGHIAIPMDRPIDSSTFIHVKFALEFFKKKGVRFILLKLDTPGGEVFSAQKIAHHLQMSDIQNHIPVVAYIDNWAISAGAMLAYSSRFIGITPQASMGAAEPVHMAGERMEAASEKINSAIRSEFRNLATFYNRNPYIAEAMVDKDLILVRRNGEVVKLKNENEIQSSDEVITEKGKLLTLDAEKLMHYGVADFEVPVHDFTLPITEADSQKSQWPAGTFPLFQQPFFKKIPNAVIIEFQDWRVGLFSILSHPVVASFLFIGMMIGFYIEINTPGFGIFGSIGIVCLALILLSGFSVYAINWIELIILIAGIIFLAVELFIIPGFGVIGMVGILLIIAGIFALMLPNLNQIEFSAKGLYSLAAIDFLHSLLWLCGAFVVGFIIIVLLAKYVMPRSGLFLRLVLRNEQTCKEDHVTGSKSKDFPKVGDRAEAYTPLRPSGKIMIGKDIFDALAEGGFIDKGEKVIISRLDGNKIFVRK